MLFLKGDFLFTINLWFQPKKTRALQMVINLILVRSSAIMMALMEKLLTQSLNVNYGST